MSNTRFHRTMIEVVVIFSIIICVGFGCAKHPPVVEQKLTPLEEECRATQKIQEELRAKQKEKADLETKIAQKKDELKRLETRLDSVKAVNPGQ